MRNTLSRHAGQPRPRGDEGMSTAEYAIGVLSACSFAAVLLKILTGDTVKGMLSDVIERALTSLF